MEAKVARREGPAGGFGGGPPRGGGGLGGPGGFGPGRRPGMPDLTSGPIGPTLVTFALPVLGTNDPGRIARIGDAARVALDRQDWFELYTHALGHEVP